MYIANFPSDFPEIQEHLKSSWMREAQKQMRIWNMDMDYLPQIIKEVDLRVLRKY